MTIDKNAASFIELITHIEATHHDYIRQTAPQLLQMTDTLVEVHGDDVAEFQPLKMWVKALMEDLMPHLMKEEQILFPAIKAMETGEQMNNCFGHIGNPINMMMHEHNEAEQILKNIRKLTNNYQAPESACKTWKTCFATLAEFDADLQAHIDIENNYLFARAMKQA
ncbi:hemerythrin domain-containing protein [Shewanella intestini]|uniref:Hemerythrin-like domain-containing protein n=1 Tax=Shewanella intestini TaxID=2017544 RepID=A0ABS5I6G3_9GAMM|nr:MULTISPECIES: hemerythrin domain-containing protein [Shewanella]MBR9729613.1 hypothetical protein [Shewanella intestini]MRG37659.1 hypothetical protein [Shewanella sp. XMDDZSB0408]